MTVVSFTAYSDPKNSLVLVASISGEAGSLSSAPMLAPRIATLCAQPLTTLVQSFG